MAEPESAHTEVHTAMHQGHGGHVSQRWIRVCDETVELAMENMATIIRGGDFELCPVCDKWAKRQKQREAAANKTKTLMRSAFRPKSRPSRIAAEVDPRIRRSSRATAGGFELGLQPW